MQKRGAAAYWEWDRVHPTYRGHQLVADERDRVVRECWRWGAMVRPESRLFLALALLVLASLEATKGFAACRTPGGSDP